MIYLDYAAHTPVIPAVLSAFCHAEEQYPGNPNSSHALGREARAALEGSIGKLADMLGADPGQVILTSGASEANNLAIKGLAHAYRHSGRHILTTHLEHPSVSGALSALQEQGYEVELLELRPDGTVDLNSLRERIRGDTVLLSICWVDSELGAVQPIEEICALLSGYPGCRLHVDATQAVGKIPVQPHSIDCLTFAAHKFHGPSGVGALIRGRNTVLTPLIHGGQGASIYRSGTPTVALATSMAAALELAQRESRQRREQVVLCRKLLTEGLGRYDRVRINSPEQGVPHILNLSVAGVKGTAFQQALDRRGVCVSVKSACSVPGTPSRPVLAVTRDKKNALYSWRISLSHLTTVAELQQFLQIFDACYKELCL